MKRIFLFYLLLHSAFCFSEKWKLFNPSWKYNFQVDSADVITNTIWVDSVSFNSIDSIFNFNKVYSRCDTCTAALGGTNPCDTCYAFLNSDIFIGNHFLYDSSYVYRVGNKPLIINTQSLTGQSWLFDSIAGIYATVDAIFIDSVFGLADTIKRILLNTGDTILLSENCGLLQWPEIIGINSYYRLKGIEIAGLGEKVPDFYDYFDFHPGDMFEYSGGWTEYTGPYPSGRSLTRRFTILNRTQSNDSIVYNCFYTDSWHAYSFGMDYYGGLSTAVDWVFVDSANHAANLYYNQPIKMEGKHFPFSDQIVTYNPGACPWYGPYCTANCDYAYIQMSRDTDNTIIKSFGLFGPYDYNTFLQLPGNLMTLLDSASGLLNLYDFSDKKTLVLKPGLGVIEMEYNHGFESYCTERLTAYVKNGDTVGVFTNIENKKVESEVLIFPVPASQYVKLIVPLSTFHYTIRNIEGKIIRFDTGTSNIINVSTLSWPDGIYFLEVNGSEKNFVKRFTIWH